jgi:hypothetical protein
VVTVGLVLVIMSILGFVWAASRRTTTAQSIWAGISSMVGTVGLLGILYDAILKNSLILDILRLAGVSKRLTASGLTDIAELHKTYDWRSIFERASELHALPLDPASWLTSEWPSLLEVAQTRKISVSLYVAEAALSTIPVSALRFKQEKNGRDGKMSSTTSPSSRCSHTLGQSQASDTC